jgi:hypothetical protein
MHVLAAAGALAADPSDRTGGFHDGGGGDNRSDGMARVRVAFRTRLNAAIARGAYDRGSARMIRLRMHAKSLAIHNNRAQPEHQ